MLTQETKRKIDSARQILVGKVPDPKAQVEQITTALIYKFMDDMDKESQELGGKARFFTNDYQKYAWTKIMDSRIGGQDRLNLYVEAITRLSQNPHLPQLFRDIFKDAFLPYRDPETLNLFLKEINGFIYEHSEDLGDAYEYLLSILGSQGDAGQFRTPRHIIDFIVAAVDPKKDETICDPACGTAGFLISAFKHILKENKEKPLTPDERKNLMDHFVGYDISPDMVRLSKVNLYLHGFPNPTIFEYDTLSNEEKWDENFDVMLANPPFMSPKGGIRPHKRFSVQANRSEVLFVDYILEHLRPNGRAGIIVPEGIIFQSATAYKALRKLLIEDGLLAVVSLPAGVFNPYAGVKTSILLFDNGLAKKTKEILFLKISNDGYNLGAQRREIDKNDLPLALEIVKEYKTALKEGKEIKLNDEQGKIAHLVAKDKIAESGDYNLSGDRYKESKIKKYEKWPIVEIDEIIDLNFGTRITKKDNQGTEYPVYGGGGESFRTDNFNRENEIVISRFAMSEQCVRFVNGKFFLLDSGFTYSVKSEAKNKVSKEFIDKIFLSKQKEIYDCSRGHAQRNLDVKRFKKIKIPLPPLEVQKEIVEQIEVKQKAIEAAKAVIENLERERRYFGQEIRKIKDVEWVELGELLENVKYTNKIQKSEFKQSGKFPIIDQSQNFIAGYWEREKDVFIIKKPVIIFGDHTRTIKYVDFNFVLGADGVKILQPNNKIISKFLYFILLSSEIKNLGYSRHFKELVRLKIPVPPIEIQKQLVAEMEEQEKIIEANKKLIGIMEQKIAEVLNDI